MVMSLSQGLRANNDADYSPSVRVGLDVSGFARQLVEPETMFREISLDVEWKYNYFVAVEAGLLDIDVQKQTHRYMAGGYYLRLGPDFNVLGRKPEAPNDLVLLSLRYGFSKLDHEAPFILIPDSYWGDFQTAVESESYRAHWVEAGISLKTELGYNIFIGWSLRGKLLLYNTREAEMEPYFIGGFGKTGRNTGLMLHYHIYYRIPLR